MEYLWFDASPYIGIGYSDGIAEGGHKTTETNKKFVKRENHEQPTNTNLGTPMLATHPFTT